MSNLLCTLMLSQEILQTALLSTEIIAANLIGVSENLSNLSLGFMKYASGIRPPIDALKPVAIAAPAFYLLITIL